MSVPDLILKQEPSREFIDQFRHHVRDIYLKLHLGDIDRETLRLLVRHFLLGAAVCSRYTEEEAIFNSLSDATEACIDAMLALEEGRDIDRNALLATEPAAALVNELIAKGETLDAMKEIGWLHEKSDAIIQQLISGRRADLAEIKNSKTASE